MPEKRNIELRSEKVRNIVGKIPPAIDRYGIMVIGLILIVIFAVALMIPYKQTITFDVTFNPSMSTNVGNAYVDNHTSQFLKTGTLVTIDVNGTPVEGHVLKVSKKRINGKFLVEIKLYDNDEITQPSTFQATVASMDKTWFNAFFNIQK